MHISEVRPSHTLGDLSTHVIEANRELLNETYEKFDCNGGPAYSEASEQLANSVQGHQLGDSGHPGGRRDRKSAFQSQLRTRSYVLAPNQSGQGLVLGHFLSV